MMIQGIIIAINKYLHSYHIYGAESLSRTEVRRLDAMSRDAAAAGRMMPDSDSARDSDFLFGVPQRSDGTLRLFWCTEKPHSMVH